MTSTIFVVIIPVYVLNTYNRYLAKKTGAEVLGDSYQPHS